MFSYGFLFSNPSVVDLLFTLLLEVSELLFFVSVPSLANYGTSEPPNIAGALVICSLLIGHLNNLCLTLVSYDILFRCSQCSKSSESKIHI